MYKSISINFGSSNDNVVYNILNSRFNPGQFVHHVHFKSLYQPNYTGEYQPYDANQLDLDTNKLYLFMKKCAHVEYVASSSINKPYANENLFNWKCFINTLINCGGAWKLRTLPEIEVLFYNSYDLSKSYLDCAYYTRNTLVELCLTPTIMEIKTGGFDCLKVFRQLEKLKILHIFVDFDEVDTFIEEYLPNHVKDIIVKFREPRNGTTV